ncbi:ParA family protein [Loktanella sp. M215]|uniref:ParA family protein n=1 Tax=Loktanella sp. M215 TaxID=2675431 RepID=UPI003FA53DB2
MPTVVIASPKGGAGKSTTAVLLGTELAHAGANVVMLDCDPNQSLTLWSDKGPVPERITVLSNVSESDIVKTIKRHDTDGQIVIVDLEGVASRLVSRAISQADLVITPPCEPPPWTQRLVYELYSLLRKRRKHWTGKFLTLSSLL